MRFLQRGGVVVLVLAAVGAGARGESYTVDGAHTSIVFSISHLGYSYTYGMFRKSRGEFELDLADPAACRFDFAVDVKSIDTMDARRDEHLLAADYFNAEEFPEASFKSKRVEKTTGEDGKDVYHATGDLTLHGVTREVTLPLKLLGVGEGPRGGHLAGFLCQTSIKRSDFGMTKSLGPLGDRVELTISFEGTRE